jgi:hypothetical protein
VHGAELAGQVQVAMDQISGPIRCFQSCLGTRGQKQAGKELKAFDLIWAGIEAIGHI